ncbi:helix-turn-helix domain-containing protein [Oribacterium sp.]
MQDYLTDEMLTYVKALKRKGVTDTELAKALGISKQTLYNWKNKSQEFRFAIRDGKMVADAQVENALFLSAIGHAKEVKTVLKDKTTGIPLVKTKGGEITLMKGEEGEEMLYYTDIQYFKPDVKAMIFYLTNRCFKEWQMNRQNKEDSEGSGLPAGVVEVVVRKEHYFTMRDWRSWSVRL